MASESYKEYTASCPGSLMIMGEHAVLYGSPCIVAAIDKYLSVSLEFTPKSQQYSQIEISSDIDKFFTSLNKSDLSSRSSSTQLSAVSSSKVSFNITEIDHLYSSNPNKFIYVLAVVKYFKQEILESNLDYKFIINSDINPSMGLGSSAAVTAASLSVVSRSLGLGFEKAQLLSIGRKVIQELQGKGSGADLAASLYGKVIMYQPDDLGVEIIADSLPLTVIYSGYKLSTKEVIKIIAEQVKSNSQIYNNIFQLIHEIVILAAQYIKNQNWIELGKLFNIHYGLQEALGTSDSILSNIIYYLRNQSTIYGAKISGSGLGDCVIGLGNIASFDNIIEGSECLDVVVAERGLIERH